MHQYRRWEKKDQEEKKQKTREIRKKLTKLTDAPKHPGPYEERHSFARSVVNLCGATVVVIPKQRCLSLQHLQSTLSEITQKQGPLFSLLPPLLPSPSSL